MKALITESLVRQLPYGDLDVFDTRCRGLVLRCRRSGRHTYRFLVRRGVWLTIGPADAFRPQDARLEAERLRGDVARGRDPILERRAAAVSSLQQFLEAEYEPWAVAHRKTGAGTLHRIRRTFGDFLAVPLAELTTRRIEQWRTARLAAGRAPATVNRDLAALRSVLTRAVEFGLLATHPLAGLRAVKVDTAPAVRYLSREEEARLRAALLERDERRRLARESANRWREARGLEPLPTFGRFSDHLAPIVLLALNTGMRRGELLSLQWDAVDLDQRVVTVHGFVAKSARTRHIPLNTEALEVLTAWRDRPGGRATGHIFSAEDGAPITDVKTAWLALMRAAGIERFRFHDLRHSFASQLVMAGVSLAVVRELLGHGDFGMTLKYAHLERAAKAAAVEQLGARR